MTRPARIPFLFLLVCSLGWLVGTPAFGQISAPQGPEPLPNIDASRDRLPRTPAADAFVAASQRTALQELGNQLPGLQFDWNPLTGTPRRLFVRGGFLSEAAEQPAEAVLRGFIQDNADAFGLTAVDFQTLSVVRASSAPGTEPIEARVRGLRHVTLDQRWLGRQVYPASLSGTVVTEAGRLLNLSGEVVPNLASAVNAAEPNLSPLDAVARAAESLGTGFDASQHAALDEPEGPERRQTVSGGAAFAADIPVRLIYFLVARDDVRLVWEVTATPAETAFMYQVLVDALTGEVLLRESLTDHDSPRWLVYSDVFAVPTDHPKDDYQPVDNPAPLSPGPATPDGTQGTLAPAVLVQTNGDPSVSPAGWIADGELNPTGNNVVAFVDRNGNSSPDAGEQPGATLVDVGGVPTRTFDFPADFSAAPETVANEHAATVNTFFMANWFHDRLMLLGFDEAAGNFQQVNFGAGGVAGDPIVARLHVGTDNSTFGTPAADGTCCPTLNAFTWTGPDPDRDSGFDQEVLIHEFTHGLSNRVIGGPNVRGLGGAGQPRGLGEGYSDIYAFLLLRQPAEDVSGNYVVGSYVTFELNPAFGQPPNWDDNYYFGIRHFPYSTDPCVNPFTLADMQPATYDPTPAPSAGCAGTPPISPWLATRSGGPHDMGEIWALSLWEVRANLIAALGASVGNELTLQLVTDSLFLLARDPTFVEARDAVLSADVARTGGVHQCDIWRGFAKRGLGLNAQTPPTGAFTEDFSVPETCRDPEPGDEALYSYSAKLVCGVQEDPEDLRLTPGRYATSINIHNPGKAEVGFTKTLSLSFPPGDQKPGEVILIAEDVLGPAQALATDCVDVRRRLFPDGLPAPYIEGFVTIRSPKSLDVTAVYTTATLDGQQSSIDVEPVGERRLKPQDSATADLLPVPNEAGHFCNREEGKLAVTVQNQGSGEAAPSRTVVDFFNFGQVTLNTGALTSGQSETALVDMPVGCFDPDCRFAIGVDTDDRIPESDEGNNRVNGVCGG